MAAVAAALAALASQDTADGGGQLAASPATAAPPSSASAADRLPTEPAAGFDPEVVSTTPPAPSTSVTSTDASPTTASTSLSTGIVVTTADPRSLAQRYAGITEPVAMGRSDGVTWKQVEAESEVPRTAEVPAIPGFEKVRSPNILLPDGRVLVVGTAESDPPIAVEYRRNPDTQPPDQPEPEWTSDARRPVRLFVYDPDRGELTAVSGVPQVGEYRTAVSEGTMADAVLQVRVLPGGQFVAYSVGYMLAAYDAERDIFIAPLPPAA